MTKLRWLGVLCTVVLFAPTAMSAPAAVTVHVVLTDYKFIPDHPESIKMKTPRTYVAGLSVRRRHFGRA